MSGHSSCRRHQSGMQWRMDRAHCPSYARRSGIASDEAQRPLVQQEGRQRVGANPEIVALSFTMGGGTSLGNRALRMPFSKGSQCRAQRPRIVSRHVHRLSPGCGICLGSTKACKCRLNSDASRGVIIGVRCHRATCVGSKEQRHMRMFASVQLLRTGGRVQGVEPVLPQHGFDAVTA